MKKTLIKTGLFKKPGFYWFFSNFRVFAAPWTDRTGGRGGCRGRTDRLGGSRASRRKQQIGDFEDRQIVTKTDLASFVFVCRQPVVGWGGNVNK